MCAPTYASGTLPVTWADIPEQSGKREGVLLVLHGSVNFVSKCGILNWVTLVWSYFVQNIMSNHKHTHTHSEPHRKLFQTQLLCRDGHSSTGPDTEKTLRKVISNRCWEQSALLVWCFPFISKVSTAFCWIPKEWLTDTQGHRRRMCRPRWT